MPRTLLISLACLGLAAEASAAAERSGDRPLKRVATMPDAAWWNLLNTGLFISDTMLNFGPKGDAGVLKGILLPKERVLGLRGFDTWV
ncbi:MAG: hypothetical protein ACJ07L_13050 [Opitutales bacterium]